MFPSRTVRTGVRLALCLATVTAAATATAQITVSSVGLFRDNEGPNTVGAGSGDNLTVSARFVQPNLSTSGFASNPALPGVKVPLSNLFLSGNGFFSRNFAADVLPNGGGTLDTPWTVTLQSRGLAAQFVSNGLAGVGQLPLLSDLQTTGTDLAPLLQWSTVVTATPYDTVRLSIYDERTDQLVWSERQVAAAGATSYALPSGLLAPGTEYSFRVLLWDEQPGVGLVNRSSTYVNRTTDSSAVSLGSLGLTQAGVDSSTSLVAGSNSFANASLGIGTSLGNASVRLASGTILDALFLNLGTSNTRTGTLVIDGTRATLTGGTLVPSSGASTTSGGHANIGRFLGSQGFITVMGGGELQIKANGLAGAGMNIGRDAGSFGIARVEGAGSRIAVEGPTLALPTASGNGLVQVGREGDGRLLVLDGGQVTNAAAGESWIGRLAGSRGAVQVAGNGSRFEAGTTLSVGVVGEGLLQVDSGGLAKAGTFLIGPKGVVTGNGGTLEGLVKVQGGVFSPGNSPGRIRIVGDLVVESGTLLLEALADGQIDGIDVTGTVSIAAGVSFDVMLGFAPTGAPLDFITATGGVTLAPGFAGPQVFALLGSDAPQGAMVDVRIGTQTFNVAVTTPVPEPAAWATLLLGLAALTLRQRKVRG